MTFIRWFEDLTLADVWLAGGKNASLGEMYRELTGAGVQVPNGFAVTSDAYRYFTRSTGVGDTISALLSGLDPSDLRALADRGHAIRQAVLSAELPPELRNEILTAYDTLGEGATIAVAVRSSATAEDLPDASFAGQQET